MENVRKYQDVKLIKCNNERDEKAFLNKVRKPSFKYARQFGDTLIGAHMGKASVTLNKPIIVGASVLGLSKLLMYRFWYGYVKERYGDNAQLGYMDTDSFIFQVKTEDIYKDMAERQIYLISMIPKLLDYSRMRPLSSTRSKHKGVSKKGMEEMATDTYMPSLLASLTDDPIDKSSLSEQEASMRADADPMTLVYRDCLFGNKVFHAKNIGFQSKDHILSLVESEKKALCFIDTKRWILSDGITTLPYRHWQI
ncbi:hypothetical protein RclHR1_01220059 [Rhizophagus clarus]|uniref:DNA-directed DNA polymerase n=1 Tax=Rhizophagus clarus TaxID=94130 RepID=A0A2Z6Q6M3_9GLOM|nr:hypothetical protein RclHR1_01220059 [Rhizophagus clarus]